MLPGVGGQAGGREATVPKLSHDISQASGREPPTAW